MNLAVIFLEFQYLWTLYTLTYATNFISVVPAFSAFAAAKAVNSAGYQTFNIFWSPLALGCTPSLRSLVANPVY